MIGRQIQQDKNEAQEQRHRPERGFSLIELVFVVLIVLVMTAMAVPLVNNSVSYFRMRGAVAAATGAIQSTRYQAIFQGCPYQIVFTAATNSYQVLNSCPSTGTFVAVCSPSTLAVCPKPLAGAGSPLTLGADMTMTFSPGGKITSATSPMVMVLTYGGKPPETITVSSYGSINVTP
jgi:prepilin-type N-terminal cleavage/methylation domain-containing protein